MTDNGLPDGWEYAEGRMELYCPHGIGHAVPWSSKAAHGCDGCCSGSPEDEHSEWKQAVEAVRE